RRRWGVRGPAAVARREDHPPRATLARGGSVPAGHGTGAEPEAAHDVSAGQVRGLVRPVTATSRRAAAPTVRTSIFDAGGRPGRPYSSRHALPLRKGPAMRRLSATLAVMLLLAPAAHAGQDRLAGNWK